jgi:hypothetical protein
MTTISKYLNQKLFHEALFFLLSFIRVGGLGYEEGIELIIKIEGKAIESKKLTFEI